MNLLDELKERALVPRTIDLPVNGMPEKGSSDEVILYFAQKIDSMDKKLDGFRADVDQRFSTLNHTIIKWDVERTAYDFAGNQKEIKDRLSKSERSFDEKLLKTEKGLEDKIEALEKKVDSDFNKRAGGRVMLAVIASAAAFIGTLVGIVVGIVTAAQGK